ncbi:hypothetical protein SVAN01_00095 [Stagonosporopsis vannaccii]|nr:hypothetical protein SVAN01_00095 [Stagonosporopsis vannaccii]
MRQQRASVGSTGGLKAAATEPLPACFLASPLPGAGWPEAINPLWRSRAALISPAPNSNPAPDRQLLRCRH